MRANGSIQRKKLKQDESVAYPTTSLKPIITPILIDAHEGRDADIFDVLGLHLQEYLTE